MGVCDSGNNTKEANIPNGTSQFKKETIIGKQPPIPIDPCLANPLKALC